MLAQQVLFSSNLFSSNGDMIRNIKQKCVKINGILIESLNEEIELGDFQNFIWFPGAINLIKQHGLNFLVVQKGKQKTLLFLNKNGEFESFI